MTARPGFRVVPIPDTQRQVTDWLALAVRRHTMHALLELDVTDARRAIRERRAETGEPLSFTAFIVASLARATEDEPSMHAHRKGRHELALFDDVDVSVVVERTIDGARIPVPSIVRAANRKSAAEITREIRDARAGEVPYPLARRALPLWLRIPGLVRRALIARWLADPVRRQRLTGTTFVSAVGMFGSGTAWALPQAQNYTLGLTLGGIARKPGFAGGPNGERVVPREYLSLTLSFDHDVVEGAPAARFTARLKELIERGSILGGSPARTARGPQTKVPA
jgi:pyruvate/2-oxoglutarate dehydrogenase complex dihydrolipoamide acyltransferase (E2) component